MFTVRSAVKSRAAGPTTTTFFVAFAKKHMSVASLAVPVVKGGSATASRPAHVPLPQDQVHSTRDDLSGTGEEEFAIGMRQNAMERDAADGDQDQMLDYNEFKRYVRDREIGNPSEQELRERFQALDEDGSGKIDMSEFLQFSLRDALLRASERVCDLFKKWDEDKSGTIDKGEFARAIRSFGIDVPRPEVDKLFDSLDEDRSGSLEYKELNTMLRKGTGSEASLKNLRRAEKLNVKKIERGLYAARVTALPDMVKLSMQSGESVPDQLKAILNRLSVKLLDLFRDWDRNGDGLIDAKEFRYAVAALGYDASREDLDVLFNELDADGNGTLEYDEFKSAIRNCSKRQFHVAALRPTATADSAAPETDASSPDLRPRFRRMPRSIVGSRVRVFWSDDNEWHKGEVVEYSSPVPYSTPKSWSTTSALSSSYRDIMRTGKRSTMWRVRYDRGEGLMGGQEVLHDFEEVKWELLE